IASRSRRWTRTRPPRRKAAMSRASADAEDVMDVRAAAIDPVCGMTVDPEHPKGGSFAHGGRTYHFCSARCRERFSADPESFLKPRKAPLPARAASAASDVDAEYTCPMHPEIVQKGPGSCPICGMALEPRAVTLGEEKNEELDDMTRRFWIAAALTAPVVVLGMAEMWLTGRWVHTAEFALSTPVVVWAG